MVDLDRLTQAMGDLDEDTVMSILSELEAGGEGAAAALAACQAGMDVIGPATRAVSTSSPT